MNFVVFLVSYYTYIQQCINICIDYRTTQLSLTDEYFSRVYFNSEMRDWTMMS